MRNWSKSVESKKTGRELSHRRLRPSVGPKKRKISAERRPKEPRERLKRGKKQQREGPFKTLKTDLQLLRERFKA